MHKQTLFFHIPFNHIWLWTLIVETLTFHFEFRCDMEKLTTWFYSPQSTPCKHPVIVLQDVAFTDLHALVEFIYHGEVNVHQRSLSSFLKTAEVLRVSGLTQQQAEETHNVNLIDQTSSEHNFMTFNYPTVSSSTKFGSIWRQNSIESSSKLHR